MPLYESLTANSTPEQIAAAYAEFTGGAGGDTAVNQGAAVDYLQSLGIAAPVIDQAYGLYNQPPAAAATGIQTLAAPTYQGLTANSTPDQIADAYTMFADQSGGDTAANQQTAQKYLTDLGISDPTINQAYDSYLADAPLYQSLNAQSTRDQVADAYRQFTQNAGGDTAENQKRATDYLGQIGVGNNTTQSAYRQYLDNESAASGLYEQFGVTDSAAAPTTDGILSGFKYAKDLGLTEDDLIKTLGKDTFNTYKAGLSDYAKTGIANILADKKLSFDEAKEVVKFGREYGYDSQQLADLTGQKKELFDTVSKTYDDATNKIVDTVLNSDEAKTEGDKIIRAVALQEKYGFSDEDLAKATDFTPAEVKNYLDPLRNYQSDYEKTIKKADVSGKDILDFLEKSKKNEGVSTAYGSNIDKQIERLNELNEKWKGYKDGYQAENIYNQVNKITEAAGGQNWSGSWMSGGDNAAKEATRLLLNKGVDNLADLGVEKTTSKFDVNADFYDGKVVRADEDGRKYIAVPNQDGSGADIRYLPADAKIVPGFVDYDNQEDKTLSRQLTDDELKNYDPKNRQLTAYSGGSKLIDKSTGKVIAENSGLRLPFFSKNKDENKFVLDSYETGNIFAGRSKQMGIMMTDQGVPVPYQTSQKEGFKYSPLFPIALALLAPGISSAISGALPGAGVAASGATAAIAPTLTNTMLTQGILGAGTAALTGQNVLKGAFLGGVGAPISAGIGSLLPAGMDPAIARAVTNAGTGAVKGALQGGDFSDLLGEGVLSGLTNYGIGEATKGLNLTPQQVNFATGIAAPLLQNKKVNPINLVGSAIQAAR
jgi:VIT1/CCC1 family predicted Fe2+/Mn2+ transporter